MLNGSEVLLDGLSRFEVNVILILLYKGARYALEYCTTPCMFFACSGLQCSHERAWCKINLDGRYWWLWSSLSIMDRKFPDDCRCRKPHLRRLCLSSQRLLTVRNKPISGRSVCLEKVICCCGTHWERIATRIIRRLGIA